MDIFFKILFGMPNIYLPILAVLLAFIPSKKPNTSYRIRLLYLLLFLFLGVGGAYFYVLHRFFPAFVAHEIGWRTSVPFQFEVAYANLSYAVLGIICFFYRNWGFWLATGISSFIYLFDDGIGHIRRIILLSDYSFANAGPILYSDMLVPVVILILLCISHKEIKMNQKA